MRKTPGSVHLDEVYPENEQLASTQPEKLGRIGETLVGGREKHKCYP